MAMPVAYVDSTWSGLNDDLVSSVAIPVPITPQANHIAILTLEQWEVGNPTVTWPPGFVQYAEVVSGSQKIKSAWKRLAGADSGDYTPTWTGTQWTVGHCVLFSGCKTTGDPIGSNFNTAVAASGTAIPVTSVTVGYSNPGFAHFVANENSASQSTPPSIAGGAMTNVENSNYLHSNYRIATGTGAFSTSGGALSASTLQIALLVALEPDTGVVATSDSLKREKQMRLGALVQM